MKGRDRWKERLVNAMEIPGDLAYREAVITLTGPRQAIVENYKCILSYTGEELVIQTKAGKVSIVGKGLEILWYTPEEMEVAGRIQGIYLDSIRG